MCANPQVPFEALMPAGQTNVSVGRSPRGNAALLRSYSWKANAKEGGELIDGLSDILCS